jgi:DNA-binding NarL/FixJ family response regulator
VKSKILFFNKTDTTERLSVLLTTFEQYELIHRFSVGTSEPTQNILQYTDVIIIDLEYLTIDSNVLIHQIKKSAPNTKLIVLSESFTSFEIAQFTFLGVSGLLQKRNATEEINRAVQTVLQQKKFMSPKITTTVIEDYLIRYVS